MGILSIGNEISHGGCVLEGDIWLLFSLITSWLPQGEQTPSLHSYHNVTLTTTLKQQSQLWMDTFKTMSPNKSFLPQVASNQVFCHQLIQRERLMFLRAQKVSAPSNKTLRSHDAVGLSLRRPKETSHPDGRTLAGQRKALFKPSLVNQ